ncbi:MAG: DegQ family serine endoprotease, partial [Desulfobulbaceae bacterium]|nr:DegQ family serine endoprotease [Desulfobulbaceae bacterium]
MKAKHVRSNKVIGLVSIMITLTVLVVSAAGWSEPLWTSLDRDNPRRPIRIMSRTFSKLAESLKPAVVNISTTMVVKQPPFFRGRPSPFGQQDPFRDFWEKFFGGEMPHEFETKSLGSGVIINKEGYIVTNNHVIENAKEILVTLSNEKDYEAEVIGKDKKTDLALIKIDAKEDLPVAPLGDSDKLEVGEWVMAIGNPFGLERTVTVGILSAKGRVIGAGPYDDFLQTDAAINPGNSGGPLFNMKGEVIGINTAIVATGQGIGFAIPINIAKELLPQLEKGKVIRGWLGVSIQEVTEDIAKSFKLEKAEGALVAEVMEDSPAEKSGLERGDIVIGFGGKNIGSPNELQRGVANTPPNKRVKAKVIRDGKTRTLTVKVGAMPDEFPEIAKTITTGLGLTVQSLTPELAEQFDWPRGEKGVLITNVESGSAGAEAGLRRGDLIVEINRQAVEDTKQYKRLVGKAKAGESLLLFVKRGSRTFYI